MKLATFRLWAAIAALLPNAVLGGLLTITQKEMSTNLGESVDDGTIRELKQFQPQVVGGNKADIGEYPFYAQWSGINLDDGEKHRCGGSLIHSDILLTAAHCDFEDGKAVVGAYFQLSAKIGYPRDVVDRVMHPDWSPELFYYMDYQVLKLRSGVPTRSVKLNSNPNVPATNERLTLVGLGRDESGDASLVLQEVNFKNVDLVTCAKAYRQDDIPINRTIHLCTGVPGGGKGQCSGDSGGPVFTAKEVQVGIVSFSAKPCARPDYPGVSARVSGGLTWIKQQVCALSSYPPQYCYKTSQTPTNVRLDVFYDTYPAITSVSIFNSSQSVYTTGPGIAAFSNTVVLTPLSLQPGYYYAQLNNALGTGFCCKNGYGFVAAFAVVNGLYKPILKPTYASFAATETFKNLAMPVPKRSSGKPISYTGTGNLARVEVYYDKFPTETSVVIVNSKKQQVVFSPGFGEADEAEKLKVFNLTLPSGKYEIKLGDSNGDGFSGAYGSGYFAVYTVARGSYQALIQPTYGIFTDKTAAKFSLPYNPKQTSRSRRRQDPLPPSSPHLKVFTNVCRDSPVKFDVRALGKGKQTCEWLAGNPTWQESLCHSKHPAYKSCPMTCGKCDNVCAGKDSRTAKFWAGGDSRNCAWLATRSDLWPTACASGMPAYFHCMDTCNSCGD